MRALRARILLGCAIPFVAGCGGGRESSLATAESAPSTAAVLGRVDVDDHPTLALVGRSGDPEPALAFTASHARGGPLSAALSGLVAARLEARGMPGIDTRAHALGFEISWLAKSEEDAERFVGAIHDALSTPVRANEAAIARARRDMQAARSMAFAGPGDAAAAACSGELGAIAGSAEADVGTPAGIARLEATRVAAFRAGAAAFAALGNQDFLDAAASALAGGEDWPTDSPDADPWLASDSISAENGTARRLTVALRLADADAAVSAADTLGSPDSDLTVRLGALTPAWTLERSSAIARPRGACLRFDVSPPRIEQGPATLDIARAASVIEATARTALANAQPGALDESLLRPTDPRRAAALAAWRALEGREKPGPERIAVAYVGAPSDRLAPAEVNRAVLATRARIGKRSFEVASRLESGQGELWMLLASPCGTAFEPASDAGALALALRAVSESASAGSVLLEPWVTADGVGILAHGPRIDPRERPEAQARRIARVLGRAIAEPLSGPHIAVARAALAAELGQAFPGWARALDGLAPEHPSLLEPRGTWTTLAALTNESLERARHVLGQFPLRFSMLANASEIQVQTAANELEDWLLPMRGELRACPPVALAPARRGALDLSSSDADVREGAYVGAVLDEASPRAARALELTTFLLNRPDGLLERAFASPRLDATARAHALGGSRRPALVIDLRAMPQDLPEALARVRAVLERLALGATGPSELKLAEAELERKDALARLDPRRRIVELWRDTRTPTLDLATLRAFQSAFRGPAHWIVQVKSGS